MVRRFINPSTIQFFLKNPTAATHGGKEQIPSWATVLLQCHADARR
jgi:hypothetical protein